MKKVIKLFVIIILIVSTILSFAIVGGCNNKASDSSQNHEFDWDYSPPFDVTQFEDIDNWDSSKLIAFYKVAEKFPKGFVVEPLKGCGRILKSTQTESELISHLQKKFTNNTIEFIDAIIKEETNHYFVVHVRWALKTGSYTYEETMVSFKPAVFDYVGNNASVIKNSTFGDVSLAFMQKVLDYWHYSRNYEIYGNKACFSNIREEKDKIIYTVYYVQFVGGDWDVKDVINLYKSEIVIDKQTKFIEDSNQELITGAYCDYS